LGVKILRIEDIKVKKDILNVLREIEYWITNIKPTPNPSKEGNGFPNPSREPNDASKKH